MFVCNKHLFIGDFIIKSSKVDTENGGKLGDNKSTLFYNIKQSFLIYKKNTIFAALFTIKLDNEARIACLFL
jgi:hypothetical protein